MPNALSLAISVGKDGSLLVADDSNGVIYKVSYSGGTSTQSANATTIPNVVKLIRRLPDERIKTIVDGWAFDYEPALALSLGFKAESTMAEIISVHVEDELGGRIE